MISNFEKEYLNKKIEELSKEGFFKAFWEQKLKNWCVHHLADDFDVNLSGVTKIVLVFDNSKYVIKFSRNPFGKTDFCCVEANNYKRAISRGLEDYFAETFSLNMPKRLSNGTKKKLAMSIMMLCGNWLKILVWMPPSTQYMVRVMTLIDLLSFVEIITLMTFISAI